MALFPFPPPISPPIGGETAPSLPPFQRGTTPNGHNAWFSAQYVRLRTFPSPLNTPRTPASEYAHFPQLKIFPYLCHSFPLLLTFGSAAFPIQLFFSTQHQISIFADSIRTSLGAFFSLILRCSAFYEPAFFECFSRVLSPNSPAVATI